MDNGAVLRVFVLVCAITFATSAAADGDKTLSPHLEGHIAIDGSLSSIFPNENSENLENLENPGNFNDQSLLEETSLTRSRDLHTAFDDATEDIKFGLQELVRQKSWVSDVDALISNLQKKKHLVSTNLIDLGSKIKGLITKRKKIQNLLLQSQLQEKLVEAQRDKQMISQAMNRVTNKQSEFDRAKSKIIQSVSQLKAAAAKLQTPPQQ